MSVNIEGNVSQTSVASGWYQNGRAVSAQEKEKMHRSRRRTMR